MVLAGVRRFLYQEWTWFRLSYKFRWAHHPTCVPYSNQRFDLFGISFCQGCTILTGSAIISFILTLVFQLRVFFLILVFYGLMLLTITIIDGLGLGRNAKRVTRASIGALLGLTLAQLILQPWTIRLLYFGGIVFTYFAYKVFRNAKPARDLCPTCPEFPQAPRCSGICDMYEANKLYQELILPVVDEDYLKKLVTSMPDLNPIEIDSSN